MIIKSLQNPRIKRVVRLRDRRERAREKAIIVEGYRAILRAVENGYPLEELYICPALYLGDNEPALIARAADAGARIIEVTAGPFAKMAFRDRPEGLLAVAPLKQRPLLEHSPGEKGFYLIVEAIERPGNLGSIFRSADAAGVDGVIVCEARTDIYDPAVVRASIGTIFSIPVLEATSCEALVWCRENGLRTVAATPQADTLYTDVDMRLRTALVLGTEKVGLSETWMAGADVRARIPMFGQADSLNVATAATLLLYEVVRQRQLPS